MKTHFTLAVVLSAVAAFAASPIFAAPAAQPAHAHSVTAVERNSSTSVVRGTTAMEVRRALGEPAEKLGNDQWLYRRFHGGAAQSRHDDCDTLVITFVDSRVSNLQLVNRPAVAVLARRFEAKKNPALYAVASK